MTATRRSVLAAAFATVPFAVHGAEKASSDCGQALKKERVKTIDGLSMAYVEAGEGDPIVFLHGNPTSSFLWRKIIPYAAPFGHCLAPDLIGMGDSDKAPDARQNDYSIARHRAHLDAFMDKVGARDRITLVVHDWGGPLGFDWARRNADKIRALIFMETFVWRMTPDAPPPVLEFFRFYRSSAGEAAVLEENQFVEQVLLKQISGNLSDAEVATYRRPFSTTGASRLPTLAFPREVPIGDDPAENAAMFDAYLNYLSQTPVPKLWINVEPGALIPEALKKIPRSWPNVLEAKVRGGHFIQEDAPHAVGRAIRDFLAAQK